MEDQKPIEEFQEWTVTLTESVSRVAERLLENLPAVLGAIVLLLVGWGVAWLMRYSTAKITEKTVNRLARTRPMDARVQQPSSYNAAPAIASRIVFWVVLLFFVLAAAELLNLQVVSDLLTDIADYLPNLLVALLILFIGLWLGEVIRAVLKRYCMKTGIHDGDQLGRIGQFLVLLIVFSIAIGQIGIDNTLLITLVAILFGVSLGSLALAFSLGAKTTVANLLAAQSIARFYNAGDTVRIGDIEGRVLRITRTVLVIETQEGQTLIPAKRFSEQESVQIINTAST